MVIANPYKKDGFQQFYYLLRFLRKSHIDGHKEHDCSKGSYAVIGKKLFGLFGLSPKQSSSSSDLREFQGIPGSSGKSQKEGQQDQGTVKQRSVAILAQAILLAAA